MTLKSYDLLIIGAGATGSCLAYEASRRGLKVALLDAGDIGGATSCRSSKLLHGGVRYLELAFKTLDLAQLRLVREALLERSHWLEQAPFLAKKLELALPTTNLLAQAYYRMGLGVYDALAGNKNIGGSRILSNNELYKALPFLKGMCRSGVAYSDGQFNDARLNLLLALTAEKGGATVRTRCKVFDFKKQKDGKICGVISEDCLGKQEQWAAKVVVNATGIHADQLRQLAEPNIPSRVLTSRGVHLVLKANLCPKGIGLLIPETNDGRVLFVLPFFGRTLVGTTDTPCSKDKAFTPSSKELAYLLKYIKHWFPKSGEPEVTSSWAGGRPLLKPSNEGVNISHVVREHEVETLPSGLISTMGGKWTTCRSIALDTLKAVEASLENSFPAPQELPLIGTTQNPSRTKKLLLEQKEALYNQLPNTPIKKEQLVHLQSNYGLKALEIIAASKKSELEPLSDLIPICKSEIRHAINKEHARTPTDILARRCRLAMIDKNESERLLPFVQEELIKAKLPKGIIDLEQ